MKSISYYSHFDGISKGVVATRENGGSELIDIEKIRKHDIPERLAITKHAKNRMFERGISVDDIVACVRNGDIIKQYEDDKPLPSCLIVGMSMSNKMMHIVVSNDEEFVYLITAYYPDPEKWNSDFKNKKEN